MTDVALVTGAAGALGAEVARTLAARGDRLVLVDGAGAKVRLEQLASTLPGACVVAGDVTDDRTLERGDAAHRARGRRDAVACSAHRRSVARRRAAVRREGRRDVARDDERERRDRPSEPACGCSPRWSRESRGSVVVVGSRAAEQPWTSANAAAYAAAKSAVVALARAVAAEVLEHGVRVNAILPSTMDTPANRAAMPKVDPSKWVSLDSAAGVIAFLLSDAARDISGAALPVYGRS